LLLVRLRCLRNDDRVSGRWRLRQCGGRDRGGCEQYQSDFRHDVLGC
jgi:hypothetical protein